MDVVRKQSIKRVDPETNPGGTPLAKAPDVDLGTDLIPKERYISPEFMEREWDSIWTKVWLLGCREDQIPEPGDYMCTNIGRESVLLVRQDNGGIKAFHNVCMHRGNRLADEGLSDHAVRTAAAKFRAPFDGLEQRFETAPYFLDQTLSVMDIA